MANQLYKNKEINGEIVKVEIISSHAYNKCQVLGGAASKYKAFMRDEDWDAADREVDDIERAAAWLRLEVAEKRRQSA